jgi:hypothetical protein
MAADKRKIDTDRRGDDRRKTVDAAYPGPERRAQDRRGGADRRTD